MGLHGLSLKELVLLGRRAERECARCFRALAGHIAPSNQSIVRAFLNHAAEEEEHDATLAGFDKRLEWPRVWHLDEGMIDRLLRDNLPCLCHDKETGSLDQTTALERAREIEDEATRFYRVLARYAPDEDSRAFFVSLAEWETKHSSVTPASLPPEAQTSASS
jgi:rubrerythrin